MDILLTWHKIQKFCCADVGRFSHSSSGLCHVSSKYLNNRHFSQCKWNKWLSLTEYMHQNCNIASSNLLMNNYGVSQFLGPDPGDMYNPHLVEMQLVRQEWLKHDFRFTLWFSSCNALKPFWESLLGPCAQAVKNQMVGHQSGQKTKLMAFWYRLILGLEDGERRRLDPHHALPEIA